MKTKILVLCTGNSCRSQMAEGIIRSLSSDFEVFSAGTRPEKQVNPFAVEVMKEIGLDISRHYPKNVDDFTGIDFDYVITVCDNAKEICPVFTGKVKNRLHVGFEDPADATGSHEEILNVYRKTRDEIDDAFSKVFKDSGQ
ncbi:MAG: arsenate reductase ArsC [Ignavibacteria bacterium]